jgi:hypothetical protein
MLAWPSMSWTSRSEPPAVTALRAVLPIPKQRRLGPYLGPWFNHNSSKIWKFGRFVAIFAVHQGRRWRFRIPPVPSRKVSAAAIAFPAALTGRTMKQPPFGFFYLTPSYCCRLSSIFGSSINRVRSDGPDCICSLPEA